MLIVLRVVPATSKDLVAINDNRYICLIDSLNANVLTTEEQRNIYISHIVMLSFVFLFYLYFNSL